MYVQCIVSGGCNPKFSCAMVVLVIWLYRWGINSKYLRC